MASRPVWPLAVDHAHNPSVRHPVFFTEHLTAPVAVTTSPTSAAASPIALPPASHIRNPVAHGACVAHNSTILAECITSAASQTSSLASLILPKIDHRMPQKLTYTHGTHQIHYIAEAASEHADDGPAPGQPSAAGGLTFLVVADAALARRIAFGFLDALRTRFLADFPPATTDFADLPNYGCAAFNGTLRAMMLEHGRAVDDDALTGVRRNMDDVRGIMGRNIESLLERGERIDLLVDQTDRLGGSARDFRVRSRGLKRHMWWKNVKLMALLVAVVALLVLAMVLSLRR